MLKVFREKLVLQGIKGDQGDQGIQGIQGETGDTGAQGVQGETGPQGLKGDQGDQGIQGIQGETGDTGAQGVQGETGPQGIKGDQGDQGIQGIQGETGDTGAQGVQGETGPQGLKGDQGDQGIQGIQGETGDTGAQGPAGQDGQPGQAGQDGATGAQGSRGQAGQDGATGSQGPAGQNGQDGQDGATGPAGDPATDDQTLSLSGSDLTISGGNTIDISSINTDDQYDDEVLLRTPIDVDEGGETSPTNETTVQEVIQAIAPITSKAARIFYPPSIAVDVSTNGTFTIDLYDEYIQQYGSPTVGSAGAPNALPTYTRTELYYYVTYADPAVFGNGTAVSGMSIDANGNLTYQVQNQPTNYNSLINVVFVVK
ncbi:Collagen triple helix repeat-containing protein [Cellulophaga algicola DSM 14237]|uniref:Collagen triple helix repeat-containing protein n=1 Tax=Cellulophaga algicola (strain DSM 14237 / IC166 / ACAM 630) TaxID=688270 RepID=E6X853_CELAD|nr:collagen-like protein [Cellulophaga algicola]ADV49679.1 Collagen triple helix repeat-containing protein [Cellulophaga algicola DSM 14237]